MQKHRERLAAITAGGQAGQYGPVVRRKTFTADQIDTLDNTEIEKMYARYEARLGAAMTKILGSSALQLYAGIAALFLPIENQQRLIADIASRATRLSDTRLAAPPASYNMACFSTVNRCADQLEALPIWTLLP